MKTKTAKAIRMPKRVETTGLLTTLKVLGKLAAQAGNKARRNEQDSVLRFYYDAEATAHAWAAAWLACDLGLAQMIDDRPADALAKAA